MRICVVALCALTMSLAGMSIAVASPAPADARARRAKARQAAKAKARAKARADAKRKRGSAKISGVPVLRLKQLGYGNFKKLHSVPMRKLSREVGAKKARALKALAKKKVKAGHLASPSADSIAPGAKTGKQGTISPLGKDKSIAPGASKAGGGPQDPNAAAGMERGDSDE